LSEATARVAAGQSQALPLPRALRPSADTLLLQLENQHRQHLAHMKVRWNSMLRNKGVSNTVVEGWGGVLGRSSRFVSLHVLHSNG
jgi:hypothetical protein